MRLPSYGDPAGHGWYGILSEDDDGNLLCHECGEHWGHLATHARLAHGITAPAYREKYGLGRSLALVGRSVKENMRAATLRRGDENLRNLERSRDPDRAREASRRVFAEDATWRPAVMQVRRAAGNARRGRALTAEEVTHLGDSIHVREWTGAAMWLMDERGLTARALGEASGLDRGTVSGRVHRGRREGWRVRPMY